RRRVPELVHEGLHRVVVLPALLADVAVRAHREAMERDLALLGPLGERLGEKGETRDEEEHAAAAACDLLGDLEACVGLPGPAGHDELAAVGGLEPLEHICDRPLLMVARLLALLEDRFRARLVLRPVYLARFEIEEIDAHSGHGGQWIR